MSTDLSTSAANCSGWFNVRRAGKSLGDVPFCTADRLRSFPGYVAVVGSLLRNSVGATVHDFAHSAGCPWAAAF